MATKATADNDVHVALTQAPDSNKGLALVEQAQSIDIVDKASHELCREFLKGAKLLKRKIEEHYAAIKAPLNAARSTVLDMERKDLAPVLLAIDVADKIDTAYVREQRRIEEQAAEAARLKAEAEEVRRRQKEADRAEAAALKLEEASENLSEREQLVVTYIVRLLLSPSHHASEADWIKACRFAKYADVTTAAQKLIRSEKIGNVIAAQVQAAHLRQESEAKQAAPINVEVVTKASKIVDGGVRTYYGCGDVDLIALCRRAVERYDAGDIMPLKALQPDLVFLNDQARQLKESFPMVWGPACKLAKRDGTILK